MRLMDIESSSRFMRVGLVALIAAASLLGRHSNASECPDVVSSKPARLVDTDVQTPLTQNLLQHWNFEEPLGFVQLGAYIDKNGATSFCCVSSSHGITAEDERTLIGRLGELQFEPATRNGQRIDVYVGLTVLAKNGSQGVISTVLLNRMMSHEQFGTRYVAPQREIDRSFWPEDWRGGKLIRAIIAVDIDSVGAPANPRVIWSEDTSKKELQMLVRIMGQQCYIPGSLAGVPKAMTYSELFIR